MTTFFTEAARNAALDALTITHVSLHSADPNTNGANELDDSGIYARQPVTFGAASGGQRAATNTPLTFDVPAGSTVAWHGYWNGTTFLGKFQPATPETFGGDGQYNIDTSTITLSNPV